MSITNRPLNNSTDIISKYIHIKTEHLKFRQRDAVGIFIRDVTDQFERERLRAQVRTEKDRVSQMENLSSVISHEIRTPLSTSIQFLDIIKLKLAEMNQSPVTVKIERFIELIRYALMINLTFVSDLLDFRMLEVQKFSKQSMNFFPTETLNFIKQLFQCQAVRQKVTIEFKALKSLDWTQISQDIE